MSLVIRRVTNPLDSALAAFGRLQRKVYFEPDNLIPASVIRIMIATPMVGRSNFLLVAEVGKKLVGGTLFHYFPKPGTGFSSFMGIAAEFRGKGIARKLHQARFEVLDEAAGKQVAAAKPVTGLFIDTVAPERLSEEELRAEQSVGSDPIARRKVFAALGFRKLDVRYEQPVGGPGGGPVTNMDLLYCPREPVESLLTETVVQTMLAYWGPWLGPVAARKHAEALRKRAGSQTIALVSPI